MKGRLCIQAGRIAYQHIREKGLVPEDIRAVLAASGSAKWLAIYGLDQAIFSHWLKDLKQEVILFGTSIGAWKFAAAAQKNPSKALARLKEAYIHQVYQGRVTPEKITARSRQIIEDFVGPEKIQEVLTHPFLKIGFSAVNCRYPMALENRAAQLAGMISAYGLNLFSRKLQSPFFQRTLFHAPGYDTNVLDMGDFGVTPVALTLENFSRALLASGSIPLLMEGVADIAGAPPGVFRDGGILDYHPAFPLGSDPKGLILYPHFYPHLIPGWFDKNLPWRRVRGKMLDHTILLSPSPEFISCLPLGRITDRQDFSRFQGQDTQRLLAWKKTADMGLFLGDDFLEAVHTGRIRDQVQLIS